MKYNVLAAVVLGTVSIPVIADAPSQLVAKLIDSTGAVVATEAFGEDDAATVSIPTNAEGDGFILSVSLLTVSGADAFGAIVSEPFSIPAPVVTPPDQTIDVKVPASLSVSVTANPVA